MLHQRNAQNEASEYPTPCPHTVQRKSRGAIEHNCVDRGHNRIGGRLRAAVRFNQLCIRMSRTDRDVHSACGTFHAGPNRERLNNATLDRPSHRCRILSCLRPELPTSKCRASKITDRPNHFEPRLSQAVSRLPLNALPLRQNPLSLPDLDQARGVRVFVRLMDDRMSAYKAPVLEVVPLDRQEWAQDSHCADS